MWHHAFTPRTVAALVVVALFSAVIAGTRADENAPTNPIEWFYVDNDSTMSLGYWFNDPTPVFPPDTIYVMPGFPEFEWFDPTYDWGGDFSWVPSFEGREGVWHLPQGQSGSLYINFPNGITTDEIVKCYWLQFEVYKEAGDWGDAWMEAWGTVYPYTHFVCGDLTDQWTRCTMWGIIDPQPPNETLVFEFDAVNSAVAIDLLYFGTRCSYGGTASPAPSTTWGQIKGLYK